jgi:hypothetical protein
VIITSYGTLASEFQKWWKNKDKSSYEGGSIFDRESTFHPVADEQTTSFESYWMKPTISRIEQPWSRRHVTTSAVNDDGH